MTPFILVDFDDTLVDTGPRFRTRRNRLFRFLEELGFSREAAERVHHEVVDRELLDLLGFGPFRLGPSFRDTYVRLCLGKGEPPDPLLAREAEALASGIESPGPLLPGALEALQELAARVPVAIYTQSHFPDYQLACVEAAGVLGVVERNRVRVTPRKCTATFREALGFFQVGRADQAWMVGNSMRCDVNPALSAGSQAIWIDTGVVWHHDRARPVHERFQRVLSFPQAVERLLTNGG